MTGYDAWKTDEVDGYTLDEIREAEEAQEAHDREEMARAGAPSVVKDYVWHQITLTGVYPEQYETISPAGNVYRLTLNEFGPVCSCPAYTFSRSYTCKHCAALLTMRPLPVDPKTAESSRRLPTSTLTPADIAALIDVPPNW